MLYTTGVNPSEMSTFQVASTSLPSILTVDAAKASSVAMKMSIVVVQEHGVDGPFAFLIDITLAVRNIGLLRMTPGKARIAQNANRSMR